MSDGEDKNTESGSKKTLTLKGSGVSQGTVRQNFSHGQSTSVVVETRKRRITLPGEAKPAAGGTTVTAAPPTVAPPRAPIKITPAAKPASTLGGLSASELDTRRRALEVAEVREIEDKKTREEEAVREQERQAELLKQQEEDAKQQEKHAAEEKTRLMNQMADDFQASVGGVIRTVRTAG